MLPAWISWDKENFVENRKVSDLLGDFLRTLKENIKIYLKIICMYMSYVHVCTCGGGSSVSAVSFAGLCENSNERDIRIYYGGECQDFYLLRCDAM